MGHASGSRQHRADQLNSVGAQLPDCPRKPQGPMYHGRRNHADDWPMGPAGVHVDPQCTSSQAGALTLSERAGRITGTSDPSSTWRGGDTTSSSGRSGGTSRQPGNAECSGAGGGGGRGGASAGAHGGDGCAYAAGCSGDSPTEAKALKRGAGALLANDDAEMRVDGQAGTSLL